MKTIYFIRHAKSSWEDFSLRDIDRPLNDRGKRDAPKMARYLKDLQVQPDLIISSPAKRARKTAKIFREVLGNPPVEIENGIYEASTADIFRIVQDIKDDYSLVLLFGHNPTFTSIANQFTHELIMNVPTCGIIKVECEIDAWKNFSGEHGKLTAFYYPK
ncbi:MAG: histidine phosphatase family protein, partial [Bacteroidota bacterium]